MASFNSIPAELILHTVEFLDSHDEFAAFATCDRRCYKLLAPLLIKVPLSEGDDCSKEDVWDENGREGDEE